MKITIIDGQGGKMGKAVIEQLKKRHPQLQLYAIGTNSAATTSMMKAGADFGAREKIHVLSMLKTLTSSSVLSVSSWPTPY